MRHHAQRETMPRDLHDAAHDRARRPVSGLADESLEGAVEAAPDVGHGVGRHADVGGDDLPSAMDLRPHDLH